MHVDFVKKQINRIPIRILRTVNDYREGQGHFLVPHNWLKLLGGGRSLYFFVVG